MARKDIRATESYVERIMIHVIKWISQPMKRSWSWLVSIYDSRNKIKKIQKISPSINKAKLEQAIDENFDKAKRLAEKEMGIKTDLENLSYEQVFEDDYKLDEENGGQ